MVIAQDKRLVVITHKQLLLASLAICLFCLPCQLSAGRIRLILTDQDGQRVSGARIASVTKWSEGHKITSYIRGRGSSVFSNRNGVALLSTRELFGDDRSGKPIPIFAYHEGRGIGCLVELYRRQNRSTYLTLQPLCHVTGMLTSDGLNELGLELEWSHVYAYWNEMRPFQCSPRENQFDFYLPPGQYRLYAYGTHTYSSTVEFAVQPGQRELSFNIDLPPDRLAQLTGKPAPEFREIKGWKNGGPVSMRDLSGKYVLLDFWGYWCGPCVAAMPDLMRLHDRFGNKGLVIVAVHNDRVSSIKEMDKKLTKVRKRHWRGRDLPFLVALDGGGTREISGTDFTAEGATTAAYGIRGYPTKVLIRPDGTVDGELKVSGKRLITKIDELLNGQPQRQQDFNKVNQLEPNETKKVLRTAPVQADPNSTASHQIAKRKSIREGAGREDRRRKRRATSDLRGQDKNLPKEVTRLIKRLRRRDMFIEASRDLPRFYHARLHFIAKEMGVHNERGAQYVGIATMIHQHADSPDVRAAVAKLLTAPDMRLQALAAEYLSWHGTTEELTLLRQVRQRDVYVAAAVRAAIAAIERRERLFAPGGTVSDVAIAEGNATATEIFRQGLQQLATHRMSLCVMSQYVCVSQCVYVYL